MVASAADMREECMHLCQTPLLRGSVGHIHENRRTYSHSADYKVLDRTR